MRYQLIAFLPVNDLQRGRRLGHVVDINTEGLGLTGSFDSKKGELYALRIGLPVEIQGQEWFDVNARCMWRVEQPESGLKLAGFRYESLHLDVVEIIEELISQYQR